MEIILMIGKSNVVFFIKRLSKDKNLKRVYNLKKKMISMDLVVKKIHVKNIPIGCFVCVSLYVC